MILVIDIIVILKTKTRLIMIRIQRMIIMIQVKNSTQIKISSLNMRKSYNLIKIIVIIAKDQSIKNIFREKATKINNFLNKKQAINMFSRVISISKTIEGEEVHNMDSLAIIHIIRFKISLKEKFKARGITKNHKEEARVSSNKQLMLEEGITISNNMKKMMNINTMRRNSQTIQLKKLHHNLKEEELLLTLLRINQHLTKQVPPACNEIKSETEHQDSIELTLKMMMNTMNQLHITEILAVITIKATTRNPMALKITMIKTMIMKNRTLITSKIARGI